MTGERVHPFGRNDPVISSGAKRYPPVISSGAKRSREIPPPSHNRHVAQGMMRPRKVFLREGGTTPPREERSSACASPASCAELAWDCKRATLPSMSMSARNAAFKLKNPISAVPSATRSFHTMQERGQSQQQVIPSMHSIASARLDPSAWLSSAAMTRV